jgi:hypothetical protein
MHRGLDHDHLEHTHGGGGAAVVHHHHNRPVPGRPAQWQTPHRDGAQEVAQPQGEADLDLVEAAFVEGFASASDPTSFLRLAHIPFEAVAGDGTRLALLRVEVDAVTDVGAVTPHLGGASMRFDPLPARMVSRRKRLRFVYFDGGKLRPLDLAQARALAAV